MDSQTQQQGGSANPPDFFDRLAKNLAQYGDNAQNNIAGMFTSMTIKDWFRAIIIVGGYLLLRPHALKFVSRGAVKKMEEDAEKEKEAESKMTPKELERAKEQLDQQEEEDQGDGTSTDWGRRARLRQRQVLKQMMDAEEQRRMEQEDDKDIEEFLTQ